MCVVDIRYDCHLDVAAWSRRYDLGEVPDRLPYGLDRLADYGLVPQARHRHRAGNLVQKVERRLVHQWRHGAQKMEGDVVLCWDEYVGVPAALLSRGPVVTGAIWVTDHPSRVAVAGLRRAAAVWALSSAQLPALAALGVRQPLHIPMGIDADFFTAHDPSEQQSLVLSVGNDRHRDHETLMRAVALLQANTRLKLITRAVVAPSDKVEHVREVSHAALRAEYQASALVALALRPNLHASGLTATLESMASARPVVISDTPGMRDYVEDGVTGLLVPPGDAEAMADAIGTLLADPARAVEMGEAGRKAVEARFTTAVQAEALAEVLRASA